MSKPPSMRATLVSSASLRLLGMGLGFLVGVQLARGLGAEGYGIYGTAMAIISIAAIVAEFGLPQLVTREVAVYSAQNDLARMPRLVSWAAFMVIKIASAILALAIPLLYFLHQGQNQALVYTLIAGYLFIVFAPIGNIYAAALRGQQLMVAGQITDVVVRPLIYSALLLATSLAIPHWTTPVSAMGMQVVSIILATAMAHALLVRAQRHGFTLDRPDQHRDRAGNWSSGAWPLALTELMRILHANLPILILATMLPADEVGVFRVAASTAAMLFFPMSVFHIVLSPIFARMYANGSIADLGKVAARAGLMMAICIGAMCLPFLIAGMDILRLVFGREYALANLPLLVIGLGTACSCLLGPGIIVLNMTGHEKQVMRSFAITLFVLLLFMPMLTWTLGGAGAALGIAMSALCWSFLMWRQVKSLLGIDISILASAPSRLSQ